jgi:hypothetical protein
MHHTTRRPRLAALAALLAAPLAATALPAHAVVGTPAATGDYTFTARLDIGDGDRACSGALVAPQWIVTAASCFADDPATSLTVPAGKPAQATTATIGRTDLTTTAGAVRDVVELVPRADRDLVLARLAGPVNTVTPVALADTAPAPGEYLTVTGYGRTTDEWAPVTMHTGAFTVDAAPTGTDLNITGTDGAAVCKGDTGGPALRVNDGIPQLVAVNSRSWQGGCFGIDESRTGAVNTRTDDLTTWIDETVHTPSATDFNDDGVDDLGLLYDYGTTDDGRGETGVWRFTSTGTDFADPVKNWDNISDFGGSWAWADSKPVHGDFNGDGKDDIAVLYDDGKAPDGRNATALWTFTSTGTDFANPVREWDSVVDGRSWAWARSKPVAGDFDGDGLDDVAVLYDNGQAANGDQHTALWVLTNTGEGFSDPVRKWDSVVDGRSWAWARSKPVAGDFDGDGKDDVAVLYDNGKAADGRYRTALWTFTGTGTGFTDPAKKWDSIADTGSSWEADKTKPLVGDFDGDGLDDVAALYDNGEADNGDRRTTLCVFSSTGTDFTDPVLGWDSVVDGRRWPWARSKPVAGDFDGDGTDDVAVLYDNGTVADGRPHTALWTFTGTGAGFGGPVKKWDSIDAGRSWAWDAVNLV